MAQRKYFEFDSIYGRIQFCNPVTVNAKTPSCQVIADSIEALVNVLHLPISGHSLEHWFAGNGIGTIKGGGGSTPKVKLSLAVLYKML
jgi:hypothetical protein